ncbi:hypothetical protein HPT25_03150 [Bacillus sp. BRMEA1]|uniref:hypothetical protein n=1 Tax=Neobacillus endophyticus TaxID=2738405 RepID=UPI0015650D85|nr:hypothetical protein [Neobacillus endophyticus]NRD76486.1 hypothetical protein [Neobacillus endophyticus]
MNEFSFAQNFSIIALNTQRSLLLSNEKRVILRCIAAAVILEIYLNNKQDETLTLEKKDLVRSSIEIYQIPVLNAFLGKNETVSHTLPYFLAEVTKLSRKVLKEIEQAFAGSLKEVKAIEEIEALLGCDYLYVSAGITIKEYRSRADLYTRLTESLRAEILEEGEMTEEALLMLWLLRESGCLHDLFSKEELKRVAARSIELFNRHPLAKKLFPIFIHRISEMGIKNFLKLKKEIMSMPTGTGIAFVFPAIERTESVFIDTEEFFPSKETRLHDVKARLESHGHHFSIIRNGAVPLIKVDNTLYEAVPSFINYEVVIHGVRLRRYPLSL